MRTSLTTILIATVAVAGLTANASAQGRHHTRAIQVAQADYSLSGIPLTVNRRSWLDSGSAVSPGSEQAYMSASTTFAKTQDQIFGPDRYGNDVMKGQPYVPGRTVSVVDFSTYPNGAGVVDNTIGYQNYYFNPTPSLPARAPALATNDDTVVPNVP